MSARSGFDLAAGVCLVIVMIASPGLATIDLISDGGFETLADGAGTFYIDNVSAKPR